MAALSPANPKCRAFTLVDVMAATVVVALVLGGLFAANSQAMELLRSAKQAAVASKCLQQRIEQIRNYNWTQVTDYTAMYDLYSVPPLPAVELPGFSEQVTVTTYIPPVPPVTVAAAPAAPYLQIARNADGTVVPGPLNTPQTSTTPDVADGTVVRVDVRITWPGPKGSPRLRETSVIICNGGIGR